MAVRFNCSAELIRILIEAGADVNAVNSAQQSPLHEASKNPVVVPVLLEAGAKANILDNINRSPLFHAAYFKQDASVSALMGAIADPHLGNSPLTHPDVSKEMKDLIKSLSK